MLFLRYYFWVSPHILLAGLLIAGYRRGLLRRLPFFILYLVFELAQFLVLLVMNWLPSTSENQYHWILVLGMGVSVLVKFGVMYELSNELLLSHSALIGLWQRVFRWTGAVLLLVAVFTSANMSSTGMQNAESIFHFLDVSSSIVQSGILLALFVFTRALHVPWRSYTSGVALGFGIFATLELATSGFHLESGSRGSIVVDLIQMAAYHICVLIWIAYVFVSDTSSVASGRGLQKEEIEFWDQEVQRMVRR
jgi:hypothetical protein